MENIEVGEYVRTRYGEIHKIIKIEENRYITSFDDYFYYVYEKYNLGGFKCDIVKHSKQLIDLVEIGDIVNKLEITSFTEKDKEHKEKIAWHNTFYGDDDIAITNNEIKTILTKEIYMANCYKVGGEDDE